MKTTSGSAGELLMYGTQSSNEAFQLRYTSSNTISLWPWGSEANVNVPTLSDGSWHHLAVVYDGATTVSVFVDGTLAGTETLGGPLNTVAAGTSGLTIGSGNDGGFVGNLARVAIYNSALSSSEIAEQAAGGDLYSAAYP
jgi:hypothetical protein